MNLIRNIKYYQIFLIVFNTSIFSSVYLIAQLYGYFLIFPPTMKYVFQFSKFDVSKASDEINLICIDYITRKGLINVPNSYAHVYINESKLFKLFIRCFLLLLNKLKLLQMRIRQLYREPWVLSNPVCNNTNMKQFILRALHRFFHLPSRI